MAKATVKAELIGESLRIDVDRGNGSTMGVDLRLPSDDPDQHKPTIMTACNLLMTNLAGISEAELRCAAYAVLMKP